MNMTRPQGLRKLTVRCKSMLWLFMLVDLSAACLSAMREALRLSDVVLGCLPGWSDEARKQSQNFLVCAGCAASVRCEAQVCAVCCVLCVVAGVRSDQEALWLFNCSGGVHGAI